MKRVMSEGAVRDVALGFWFLIIIRFLVGNRGSSVGIATGLMAGRPKIWSSLPCRGSRYFSPYRSGRFWDPAVGIGSFVLGDKAAGA
jgi:hypothetical protein